MVDRAVAPKVLKNYLLKIAADNYEKHVSEVTLNPSSSIQTWQGAAPGAVFTDVTDATWSLVLGYAQDWTTTSSLSQYLLENEGDTVAMEFSPLGAGPKFTVSVIITPGAIGGAINSFGTASVTLGVVGKPTFTPAA